MAIGGRFERLRSSSVLLLHMVIVHTFAYFM